MLALNAENNQGLGFPGLLDTLGRRVCLEQTSLQPGAVLHGAVRTTSRRLHGSNPLQYLHSQAGAHHVTATNGLESLRPCSLSDVTVEGSRLSGSSRRFQIWPGDQGWDLS